MQLGLIIAMAIPAAFRGGGTPPDEDAPLLERVRAGEEDAFAALVARHRPAMLQRDVVMLRDVDGLSGSEVSELLDISEANQRVLLHRGRSRLRQALETELGAGR